MSDQTPPPPPPAPTTYGGWLPRVGAYLIDTVPLGILLAVLTALFGESQGTTTDSSASFSFNLSGVPALIYFLVAVGWFVYNWLLRQGSTGQTVGKKVTGIAVVGLQSGQPIGAGLTFARQLVHVVDGLPCLIGYLWPLWDREKRTFADMIMSTRVVKR